MHRIPKAARGYLAVFSVSFGLGAVCVGGLNWGEQWAADRLWSRFDAEARPAIYAFEQWRSTHDQSKLEPMLNGASLGWSAPMLMAASAAEYHKRPELRDRAILDFYLAAPNYELKAGLGMIFGDGSDEPHIDPNIPLLTTLSDAQRASLRMCNQRLSQSWMPKSMMWFEVALNEIGIGRRTCGDLPV